MSQRIKDFMVKDVIDVGAGATVWEAVGLMNKHEIGCLIVTKRSKPVGIVTERDMLKRVLAKLKDPRKVKVKEIMSNPLVTVSPKTDIRDAAGIMLRRRIKKLPVVENGCLIGLVTLTDLIFSYYYKKTSQRVETMNYVEGMVEGRV